MRRFYKTAKVEPYQQGFRILLDARPLPTPAKAPLVLPNSALAEAIAGEWNGQGEKVEPASMPLMQIASTAIDRVGLQREQVIADTLAYLRTDLLCHRAAFPPELVARQSRAWDPPLAWLRRRHGVTLTVTEGVVAAPQSEEAVARIASELGRLDDLRLTALSLLTAGLGSIVLALAMQEGELAWEAGFAAAILDETFQAERWGEDSEETKRRANLRRDIEAYGRFLVLLGSS